MANVTASPYYYEENITLADGVALYGGFAGAEDVREKRDWVTNVTTLDGAEKGSVVTVSGCSDEATRVDGFTIQNGTGTNGPYGARGGGVFCSSSHATVCNNIVTDNVAAQGGGVYCSDSCEIRSNIIKGNTATDPIFGGNGGGIFYSSCPLISSNAIVDNTADVGAGICGECQFLAGEITSNTIAYNHDGEGIRVRGYATGQERYATTLLISNCIVCSNEGIGVCMYDLTSPTFSTAVVRCNDAWDNNTAGQEDNYDGISDPTGTNGNISQDPGLDSQDPDDVHIPSNSPCKDVGFNGDVVALALDIDREYRIQDGTVDIGADEATGCVQDVLTLTANRTGTAPSEVPVVTAHVNRP